MLRITLVTKGLQLRKREYVVCVFFFEAVLLKNTSVPRER